MTGASGSRPLRSGHQHLPRSSQKLAAVLGPTNTGKTHYAVERMLGHESGMIGAPLRLLAREIYDRIVAARGPRAVALMTGEEKIVPDRPSYWVCTVEAMPMDRQVSFMAIDEVQLAQDPERGHTFTDRILHARGSQETLFLGAATMRGVLRQLVPDIEFLSRTRLSQLRYSGQKKVSRLPRRSAIVAFSADQVYGLAELLRRQRGGAAVVMGALSPRTRNAQVALYQSGEVDFIVATDAIGMGLNMDIDHVAFAASRKFDGTQMRALKPPELGQIAGRAGRYMNDGTFGVTGDTKPFDAEMVEQIESHRFDPVRAVQWRNSELNFSSVNQLIESLEQPPHGRTLLRPKPAIDLIALKQMNTDPRIRAIATSEPVVRALWNVCQVPDFQQTMIDNHVRLLSNIFLHLSEGDGVLPEDWLAAQIERLDETTGEIDTLSTRIAHVRTWTFVSNRGQWLKQPRYWQQRTREIEDKLSDALHDKLTQAFIDRRTSVLMKRLHQSDTLIASVEKSGEVLVEGEFVGRLTGFQFLLDPRATKTKSALESKALRAAATRALQPVVRGVMDRLLNAPDEAFSLQETGTLLWEGQPVARLEAGESALHPRTEIITNDLVSDLMNNSARDQVKERLTTWVKNHIEATIAPLLEIEKASTGNSTIANDAPIPLGAERKPEIDGLARGIAFQLAENLGALDRSKVADQIKDLQPPERAQLRGLGVRFGEFSIYMPALLKPAPARLMVLLWAVKNGLTFSEQGVPTPPQAGLTSVAYDESWTDAFLGAAGYRKCRTRAVRIDILERIGNLIREQRFPNSDTSKKSKPGKPAQKSEPASAEPAAESGPQPPAPANDTGEPSLQEQTPPPAAETPVAPPEPKPEPTPATATEEPVRPKLPPGSFMITPEMLSLAGCSADDFGEVLRSLGYRSSVLRTEKPDQNDTGDTASSQNTSPENASPKNASPKNASPKNASSESVVAESAATENPTTGAPTASTDPVESTTDEAQNGAEAAAKLEEPAGETAEKEQKEILFWRMQRPKHQRHAKRRPHPDNGQASNQSGDGKKPGAGKSRHKTRKDHQHTNDKHPHKNRKNQKPGGKHNKSRPKEADPNSPFAVLAQLKGSL